MSRHSKLLLGLLLCFSVTTKGASFKGHQKNPENEMMKYTESVDRFTESPKEFLVLISKNAAFYSFPKKESSAGEVRDFLKIRAKSKSLIMFEIDPVTAQILSMSDLKK